MSQPEGGAKPRYSAAGTAALLIIGLLILVPSGLCTAFWAAERFSTRSSIPKMPMTLYQ